MIKSIDDYRYFLEADKIALKIQGSWIDFLTNDIWQFERLLRKVEYHLNCRKSFIWKPYIFILKIQLFSKAKSLGFTIPPNVFGPGLRIAHRGTIVVNENSRIGKNCLVHTCVTIGTEAGYCDRAPQIGDNVYIGPGAKIFGPIQIADNIAIGANSVVNKSFSEPGITIAGIPAKKISKKGSEGLLTKATLQVDNAFSYRQEF